MNMTKTMKSEMMYSLGGSLLLLKNRKHVLLATKHITTADILTDDTISNVPFTQDEVDKYTGLFTHKLFPADDECDGIQILGINYKKIKIRKT